MIDVMRKLNNQIEIDKEVLSVLPKKNKKNLKEYKDKATEIKQEYVNFFNDVKAEIKRRYVKLNSVSINPKIEELSKEIEDMNIIKQLDDNTTPFEKMKLDETLFILKRFYKNNLELVNGSISQCLEKFSEAGVDLDVDDFNYSIYTKDYMRVFLDEMKNGDTNSQIVKSTFEELYWKCPDIILHIELNFRSLYLKHIKEIANYYSNEEKKILKQQKLKKDELIKKYYILKSRLNDLINSDTALILENFKNGDELAKDYEFENVQKCYKKLTSREYADIEKDELEEYNSNIGKLANSLYEYKNYLKYKFIYDEIIEIYQKKEKYKKLYNERIKKIEKIESKLFKQNKKLEKYTRHRGLLAKIFKKNQNKLEKMNINSNEQILELKTLYRELEDNKVNDVFSTELTDASTIYDALLLASTFYSFLVNTIIKQYEDMEQGQIMKFIEEFRSFVEFPNIATINNIKISDKKDIALVIKDKYNLCNISLEKGDFSEDNINSIATTANCICNYNYINECKLSLEDIKFILEASKILEQE